jgi:hypothetical protein
MAEDEKERIDRELIELLNEVRVALPGVQVLFAFLLTLPFTQRFERLTRTDEHIYVGALLMSAASAAFLIAPTAHHRLTFRRQAKEALLRWANVLVLIGVTCLALAVGSAVYLATTMVEREGLAATIAAAVTVATALLWFAFPVLVLRRSDATAPPPPDAEARG